METLAGRDITLLEWLHRKRLAGSVMVIEEATIPNYPSQLESSMDSTANPSSVYIIVLVVPPLTKNIVKTEHDNRKPSYYSAKVVLKGPSSKRKSGVEKILSLEGVMSHPDKLTDLTSPKRQRTTRSGAAKIRGLSYLSNQPSS
ncbi:unnamed protein product [Lactuca virosa]|uniref:Uncharacterized protein n=1 Tax=Lactuca virosa TaxID=75947 RepID=A0AAU9MFP4_9ASTR|nr:unnamed protein product [Lactuca virosa]